MYVAFGASGSWQLSWIRYGHLERLWRLATIDDGYPAGPEHEAAAERYLIARFAEGHATLLAQFPVYGTFLDHRHMRCVGGGPETRYIGNWAIRGLDCPARSTELTHNSTVGHKKKGEAVDWASGVGCRVQNSTPQSVAPDLGLGLLRESSRALLLVDLFPHFCR